MKDGRISVSAIRAEGEEGRRFEVTLLNDGGGRMWRWTWSIF